MYVALKAILFIIINLYLYTGSGDFLQATIALENKNKLQFLSGVW